MSLIHWWPLNGDTKDYGINSTNLTGTPSYNNYGKIGKCIGPGCGTLTMPSSETKNSLSNTHTSIAFWFNNNGEMTGDCTICGTSGNGRWGEIGRTWDFFNYPTKNDFHWSMGDFGVGVLSNVFEDNTWHHIAVVADETYLYIYIDSDLKYKSTHGTISDFEGTYGICTSDANYKINDFRIYNHALSLKEVRELSKGLMLHYNFEDPTATAYGNKLQGTQYVSGNLAKSNAFTKTGPFEDEIGDSYYTFKLNYTGTGNNNWFSIWTSSFPFTVDKRHQYSCDVRVRQCTSNCALYMRAARSSNDWVTTSTGIVTSSLADGAWKRINISNIIPESYNRSGEIVTSNPQWEAYTNNCNANGELYSCEFDIKNIQVVESDEEIPFLPSTTTIITDNSGYGYNGIISGCSCYHPTDNPNGNYSLDTNTSGYVQLPSIHLDTKFTVTTWVKHLDSFSTWARIFDFGTATQGTDYDIGLATSDGNGTISVFGRIAGGQLPDRTFGTIDFNWHMLTVVVDGTLIKFYKDTVLVNSYTANGNVGGITYTLNYLNKSNWSGDGVSNKNYADFKIYATALSADDIKAEYNRKASIDKQGNLYTGLFEQNTTNIALPTKTDIVKANHYVEGLSKTSLQESYVELEYIESSGTQYIDTGFVDSDGIHSVYKALWKSTQGGYIVGSHNIKSPYGRNGAYWSQLTQFEFGYGESCPHFGSGNIDIIYEVDFKTTYQNAYLRVKGGNYSNWTTFITTSGQVISQNNIWVLYNQYSKNIGGSEHSPTSAKVYYVLLYDHNDNLVRHLIPAKRKSDSTIGLYDLVNKQFYTNQGTGTFTAGPELNKLNVIYTNELKEI